MRYIGTNRKEVREFAGHMPPCQSGDWVIRDGRQVFALPDSDFWQEYEETLSGRI